MLGNSTEITSIGQNYSCSSVSKVCNLINHKFILTCKFERRLWTTFSFWTKSAFCRLNSQPKCHKKSHLHMSLDILFIYLKVCYIFAGLRRINFICIIFYAIPIITKYFIFLSHNFIPHIFVYLFIYLVCLF